MECPKCHTITGDKFCYKCGTKTVSQPLCNWCWKVLDPADDFCPTCGRTRNEAINTSPKNPFLHFFKVIFGKTAKKPA